MRVALLQLLVGADKEANVAHAAKFVKQAATEGKARMVVLPEFFNAPYGSQYFAKYAEPIHQTNEGPTVTAMARWARELNIFLVGGSIPECDGEKLYNTACVFDPTGAIVAKHRKMHLFDIDVPGKIRFQESETLTAGNSFTTFKADEFTVGVGICYDMRFGEMARCYALRKGCNLLVYPGAFNMTTGPLHWQLLARARAVDAQCYTLVCSPARDTTASYVAWGHSVGVDPWGTIVCEADEKETILYADLDMAKVAEVRKALPVMNQRRTDLYDTVMKG